MNKKGYTLVEIIAVIALIAVICGLFVLNFSRKNNNQLEENYNNEIKKIESAADTYVMTNKSSSDSKYEIIKYTAANEEETFCYITLEDLVDDGFLNKIPINPKTNEEFEGVVKFTKLKMVLMILNILKMMMDIYCLFMKKWSNISRKTCTSRYL